MLWKMAAHVARTRTVPHWASKSDLEELGMSADYGIDLDSASTHTNLEEEDLETTDTRTSVRHKDACKCGGSCSGGCSCSG